MPLIDSFSIITRRAWVAFFLVMFSAKSTDLNTAARILIGATPGTKEATAEVNFE
jgi:hypothetical protein